MRYANQLPQPIESLIAKLKGEKPHWGARKIRELLVRRLAGDVRVAARSTILVFTTNGVTPTSGFGRAKERLERHG